MSRWKGEWDRTTARVSWRDQRCKRKWRLKWVQLMGSLWSLTVTVAAEQVTAGKVTVRRLTNERYWSRSAWAEARKWRPLNSPGSALWRKSSQLAMLSFVLFLILLPFHLYGGKENKKAIVGVFLYLIHKLNSNLLNSYNIEILYMYMIYLYQDIWKNKWICDT